VRYLVLSDIHANCDALDAVLAHAEGRYDVILNCGDLVGYGAEPNRAIEFGRTRCKVVIRGNHDKVAAGLGDIEWFNPIARAAAVWTMAALTPENAEYLVRLPHGPVEIESFSLVHGSPADEDEYVSEPAEVRVAAASAHTGLSFFGHTHIQGGFLVNRHGVRPLPDGPIVIEESSTYLINPGSVGQPRDGDPRAGYALYDSSERLLTLERVKYDVAAACRKIRDAGLPEVLGRRLFDGR
jgi:predicted phosphodiesterase